MIGITMRTIFFITSPVASSREWVSLASLFLIFFRFTQYTKSMKSNADATPAPVPIVAPAAPQAFRTDSSALLNLFKHDSRHQDCKNRYKTLFHNLGQ